MLEICFKFTEEFLLIGYIVIGILCSSFQQGFGSQSLVAKKNYFLFFKFTFFVVLLCLISNLWTLYTLDTAFEPLVDSIVTHEFYSVTITDSYGNFFFRKDFLVLFYNLILTGLILFFLVLVFEYTKTTTESVKYFIEVPVLIITTFLGLKIFLVAYDLMLIVLALELTAFCSIILMCLQLNTQSTNTFPFEAAIKYFIFNAISISLFLFGISGYYVLFKSLNILQYTFYFIFEPAFCYENMEMLLVFHVFFFVAYLMKLGAAPFHQWVPDVYEGAELLITAFLVLLIGPVLNFKLFIFIKTLLPIFEINSLLFLLFFTCGFISVFLGSFNAFTQFRIKRFLAYTGITHLGYMLISFGTASFLGFFASFFYLFFYIITNCGFFSILLLSKRMSGMNLIFFNQIKSLVTDNILLVFLFLIPVLSFAGFPPLAGFFSKFFMLLAVLDLNKIILTVLLLFYVLLSAYLYLRFIKVSLFETNWYTIYFPIQQKTKSYYYKLTNTYKLVKTLFRNSNFLLFTLFLLNISLLCVIFVLPTVSLFFQKPLLTLFLFY